MIGTLDFKAFARSMRIGIAASDPAEVEEYIVRHEGYVETCALGAAAFGANPDLVDLASDHEVAAALAPMVGGDIFDAGVVVADPEDGEPTQFAQLVVRLFDDRRWTRERIADWAEGLTTVD